jgi:single-stranded DNA-binding protein
VAAFGKIAEACAKYLKGRQVYVEGRLRPSEFEAKNNGGKR